MNNLESQCGSISELLQIFRHIKTNPTKQLSSLSFSQDSSYNSQQNHIRNPLGSITSINTNQSKGLFDKTTNQKAQSSFLKQKQSYQSHKHKNANLSYGSNSNVFQKLYHQKKQIDQRKCRLQYQIKRSLEQKQKSECTFSPNIYASRKNKSIDAYQSKNAQTRIRTEYDSVEENQSFYNRNIEWLERKDKSIKKLQCEKNQQKIHELTFTPHINKFKKKKTNENQENERSKIQKSKGVQSFLERQKKAKAIQQYIQNKKKNPYSHVWNVKKGHFSYIK